MSDAVMVPRGETSYEFQRDAMTTDRSALSLLPLELAHKVVEGGLRVSGVCLQPVRGAFDLATKPMWWMLRQLSRPGRLHLPLKMGNAE